MISPTIQSTGFAYVMVLVIALFAWFKTRLHHISFGERHDLSLGSTCLNLAYTIRESHTGDRIATTD